MWGVSTSTCTLPVRVTVIDPEGRKRIAEFGLGDVGPIRVGRAPENDIQLISPYISRRHAEIWPSKSGVLFEDLSSTSGSYVDGARVDRTIVEVDEDIHLGSPDGLRLYVQRVEIEPPEEERDFTQTEVLRIADLESSSYLTSTGRLFARPGLHPDKVREAAALRTEQRLIGLITLTSELLEVNDASDMARTLLAKVFGLIGVERGMVLLEQDGRLQPEAWKARSEGEIVVADKLRGPQTLEKGLIPSGTNDPNIPFRPIRTVTERVFDEGVGLLSLDATSDQRLEASRSLVLQSVRSILCAPIASAKRVYGVLYVDTHETMSEKDEDDLDWLVAVAHQAGMVMDNLAALEQRQRMTESLMRGLAASIDARDGLTAGHSARVAHYSVGVARQLGLNVDEQYAIYYAALLHDYGKIGIDDAVLKKPGRLTPEEFDHIKLHPKFTFDILSKIDFPPELENLPMVAASHHERWDGDGYPWGLSEDAIPLGGRIMAIADVYDSLTRKRHYRDPMPLDEVLAYLEEGRGTHFCPTSLDAFFAYHEAELAQKEERRSERKRHAARREEASQRNARGIASRTSALEEPTSDPVSDASDDSLRDSGADELSPVQEQAAARQLAETTSAQRVPERPSSPPSSPAGFPNTDDLEDATIRLE